MYLHGARTRISLPNHRTYLAITYQIKYKDLKNVSL